MSDDSAIKRWERFAPRLLNPVAEVWRAGWDFVYPPVCFLCGCDIPSRSIHKFCAICERDLAPLILDGCQRCGAPVGPYLDTALGCIHCKTTPFHFDGLIRLGVYKDLLRSACLTIKKPGKELLAQALAEMLWSRESARFEAAHVERVLCVPRHWTRRLFPGHNPSETLARWFAARLGIPAAVHQVRKIRRTPKQAALPRTRRLSNLRDAFRLRRPRSIANRNILLVDDVLTTGTTINRIGRLLRKAGAKTITVAVIARSLGDG
jgi:ComF family protein